MSQGEGGGSRETEGQHAPDKRDSELGVKSEARDERDKRDDSETAAAGVSGGGGGVGGVWSGAVFFLVFAAN